MNGNAETARFIYVMMSEMPLVFKVVQQAKEYICQVHNYETAEIFLKIALEKRPLLMIFDWDSREAEAFKVLKETIQNADLKKVPVIGYVSQPKTALKEEAERAGCDRVYTKTDFVRSLPDILMRYVL